MRVIAGMFRGRRLDAPEGMMTRPITDRVKETLFNILGHRFTQPGGLPDFAVLDVFAGTGGLGIEALSRGARSCVFVERDRRALRSLHQNIRRLRIDEICTVLSENAWTMRPPAAPEGFGLVFVDPPYRDSEDPLRVVDLLERLAPALSAEGLIVYRQEARSRDVHVARTPPVQELRGLRCLDERRIGSMKLVFLGRTKDETEGAGGLAANRAVRDVARREQVEEERGTQDVRHDPDRQLRPR